MAKLNPFLQIYKFEDSNHRSNAYDSDPLDPRHFGFQDPDYGSRSKGKISTQKLLKKKIFSKNPMELSRCHKL